MKKALTFSWIITAALGLVWSSAASAQNCVEGYGEAVVLVENGHEVNAERLADFTALITKRDLYNSKGKKLNNIGAIIQQDRANLHKSGQADVDGDWQDQRDTYFTTSKRRSLLSTARYYMPCYLSAHYVERFRSDIISGHVLGVLGVVVFRHPDGKPAVFIEPVN